METSDIAAKLREAGIEDATPELVEECLSKGWVLDSDQQILELAMSLQEAAPSSKKKSKGGNLAKATGSEMSAQEVGGLQEGDEPVDSETPPHFTAALKQAAQHVGQEFAVMKTELRAGADLAARRNASELVQIVQGVSDKTEEYFVQQVGGYQSRVGSFRSRFQKHAADLFS